ncbi:inosine-5'-monophosphate dehydrogenase [Halalkalicoccus paucihalophilus]|jgi:CBS domain-containing protein|uniref:Inosine-5'-monophosphate dehydrogenase n=1 Tax=Halalkalicoccus paucihalophilus TaxID=1008153 RepID=A0A151ADC0_9EURY|nr:CBS domain-containing protein [Halalkalicoccus paucihalophilus]KYH25658.1 inosine-5'-monophosphate dehydrogenase [Halalkalicoccus paucihalophilus]
MIDTPVTELMTSPIRTIDPEATGVAAARELTEQKIGSLVVGEGRIEGIVTETDIVAGVADGIDLSETPVSALMSDPVVTISPTDSVRAAGERMGRNNVKKLPIARNGEAVGIVTTTDLARFVPKNAVRMSRQPEPDIEKGEFE